MSISITQGHLWSVSLKTNDDSFNDNNNQLIKTIENNGQKIMEEIKWFLKLMVLRGIIFKMMLWSQVYG